MPRLPQDVSKSLPTRETLDTPTTLKARKTWTWNCAYCGQEFTSKSYTARYCCRLHRQKAYEERKRTGKETEPRERQKRPRGRPRKNK